jgi:hypothetical protein
MILVPRRSVLPVHARATLGHTSPHLGRILQLQEDAQLVPSCSAAFGSPVFQRRPGSCLRKLEVDADGLNCNAAKKHYQ